MSEKDMAKAFGLVRVAFGTFGFFMPTKSMRAWIGREAKPYPTNMVLRGMAVRDAALGIGLLAALENDGEVRGWLEGCALSDLGDAVGTLGSWKDLPGLRRLLLLAVEVGSAAVAMQLAAALDD